MQLELIELQKEVGVTFVFVTHSQAEALALSHRIAVMNRGRVEQMDEPSRIYGFPRNRFVADFIGNINMYEAEVKESAQGQVRLQVAGMGEVAAPPAEGAAAGGKGAFAIRPEQVRIATREETSQLKNHFPGKVHDFLYTGDVTTYIVDLDAGAQIEALLPNSAPGRAKFFEVGDRVAVEWRHDAGVFLGD